MGHRRTRPTPVVIPSTDLFQWPTVQMSRQSDKKMTLSSSQYTSIIGVNLSEKVVEIDDFGERCSQGHGGDHINELLEKALNRL